MGSLDESLTIVCECIDEFLVLRLESDVGSLESIEKCHIDSCTYIRILCSCVRIDSSVNSAIIESDIGSIKIGLGIGSECCILCNDIVEFLDLFIEREDTCGDILTIVSEECDMFIERVGSIKTLIKESDDISSEEIGIILYHRHICSDESLLSLVWIR